MSKTLAELYDETHGKQSMKYTYMAKGFSEKPSLAMRINLLEDQVHQLKLAVNRLTEEF